MEALLGILVGAILGFFLGEFRTRFDRQRKKTDLARALHTEIFLDRKGLENALGVFAAERGKGRVTRPRGPTFTREVYKGCIGDLALLPRDTRYKVQSFYASVSDVEFLVAVGEEWEKLSVSDREKLLALFVERAEEAVQGADIALKGLDKLVD